MKSGLANAVGGLIQQGGHKLKVGFVTGDDVTSKFDGLVKSGIFFKTPRQWNLTSSKGIDLST